MLYVPFKQITVTTIQTIMCIRANCTGRVRSCSHYGNFLRSFFLKSKVWVVSTSMKFVHPASCNAVAASLIVIEPFDTLSLSDSNIFFIVPLLF